MLIPEENECGSVATAYCLTVTVSVTEYLLCSVLGHGVCMQDTACALEALDTRLGYA